MHQTPSEAAAHSYEYLRHLAQSGVGRRFKSLANEELALDIGHVVVDIGCGPGADLSTYAEAVGPSGKVIGLDIDAELVGHARAATGHLTQVSVEAADAHALPVSSQSADRVHIDRMLQHVSSPATAIGEAARIQRNGGRVVCVEPDWATLCIDHPDVGISLAYSRFNVEHTAPHPTVGRALPRLLRDAGLTVSTVLPVTMVFDDVHEADRILTIRPVAQRAVTTGHLTADQGRRWLHHLDTEPFFASITLFVVAADR